MLYKEAVIYNKNDCFRRASPPPTDVKTVESELEMLDINFQRLFLDDEEKIMSSLKKLVELAYKSEYCVEDNIIDRLLVLLNHENANIQAGVQSLLAMLAKFAFLHEILVSKGVIKYFIDNIFVYTPPLIGLGHFCHNSVENKDFIVSEGVLDMIEKELNPSAKFKIEIGPSLYFIERFLDSETEKELIYILMYNIGCIFSVFQIDDQILALKLFCKFASLNDVNRDHIIEIGLLPHLGNGINYFNDRFQKNLLDFHYIMLSSGHFINSLLDNQHDYNITHEIKVLDLYLVHSNPKLGIVAFKSLMLILREDPSSVYIIQNLSSAIKKYSESSYMIRCTVFMDIVDTLKSMENYKIEITFKIDDLYDALFELMPEPDISCLCFGLEICLLIVRVESICSFSNNSFFAEFLSKKIVQEYLLKLYNIISDSIEVGQEDSDNLDLLLNSLQRFIK